MASISRGSHGSLTHRSPWLSCKREVNAAAILERAYAIEAGYRWHFAFPRIVRAACQRLHDRVQTCRPHVYQNLTIPGFRLLEILLAGWLTQHVDDCGFHEQPPMQF